MIPSLKSNKNFVLPIGSSKENGTASVILASSTTWSKQDGMSKKDAQTLR